MNIQRIIEANLGSILAVIIGLLFIWQLWRSGRKETVKELILSLVVKAESHYGSGTGEIKYATVVEAVYRALPPIVLFFLTDKELDNMIEGAVQYWKECLQVESLEIGIAEKDVVYPNQDETEFGK